MKLKAFCSVKPGEGEDKLQERRKSVQGAGGTEGPVAPGTDPELRTQQESTDPIRAPAERRRRLGASCRGGAAFPSTEEAVVDEKGPCADLTSWGG